LNELREDQITGIGNAADTQRAQFAEGQLAPECERSQARENKTFVLNIVTYGDSSMRTEPSFDQSWKNIYESDALLKQKQISLLRSTRQFLQMAYERAEHVVNLMKHPQRLAEMIKSLTEFAGVNGQKAISAWLDDRFAPFTAVFKSFSYRDLIAGIESKKLSPRAFIGGQNPALLRKTLPAFHVSKPSVADEPIPTAVDPVERAKRLEAMVKRLRAEVAMYRPYVKRCQLLEKELAAIKRTLKRFEVAEVV
jgi:hypothetical protein